MKAFLKQIIPKILIGLLINPYHWVEALPANLRWGSINNQEKTMSHLDID